MQNFHLGAIEVENRHEARREAPSAPRRDGIRPAQPFWVQNFHLGVIEVENRHERAQNLRARPEAGIRRRNGRRHTPSHHRFAHDMAPTASTKTGAPANHPDLGPLPRRRGRRLGRRTGWPLGRRRRPAAPTSAIACRRLRLRTLLMSEFHPREPPPSQVSWGAVVALWQ